MPADARQGLEGHPRGGPLVFRGTPRPVSTLAILGVVLLIAGCGSRQGGPGRPGSGRQEALARPLEIYTQMGLLAGPAHFPAVASLSTLAGPGDSTYVVLSMSLPNSALRFQRDENGFAAAYRVSAAFVQDSAEVRRLDAREEVRVGTFAETGRTDESIIFQQVVAVRPGRYEVRLDAGDANSSRGFRAVDTLDVPRYGAGGARVSAPLLVYHADGRGGRGQQPVMIANPRHAAPYGGEAPRVYLESYGLAAEQPLQVRVVSEAGAEVWSADARLVHGGDSVRYGVIDLPAAALPLGRFQVEVTGPGSGTARAPLVLTISDQWMVANFEDVLEFLRLIAHGDELDSLRTGTPAERRARWEAFWDRRDPLPITDLNEFRDEFFQRVRYATEAFREPGGRAGWQTDRGEVYIVLGPPDQALERYIGVSQMTIEPNAEEWYYSRVPGGRLVLLFLDRTGFGRFELTPADEAAFRNTAEQLKPRRR